MDLDPESDSWIWITDNPGMPECDGKLDILVQLCLNVVYKSGDRSLDTRALLN